MKIENYHHIPVLLKEVIEFLNPQPGQNFIDATLGGGGYTRELLKYNQPNGKVLAIDLDQDSIKSFKSKYLNPDSQSNTETKSINLDPVILHHGNFKDIDKIIKHYDIEAPEGIVADIGLSSFQLDQSERGLSFKKREMLDMRFDRKAQTEDAYFILNNYDAKRLSEIFKTYGEEKYSGQIARKIIEKKFKGLEIKYTTDLYETIKESLPKPVKHKTDDSARRIFQALRIAVNHELENLETFLPKAFNLLKPGGRLALVTFHSLEDRIVKQYFVKLSIGCVCPPEFPQCICGKNPQGKILTKKPVIANSKEVLENVRSKSAKLRVVEKI